METKLVKTNSQPVALVEAPEEIDRLIGSIKRRGKNLDTDIQLAALSAMQHHSLHGDTTLINRLVKAMPSGSRVNALKAYIETFGKVSYRKGEFVHNKHKEFNLNGALERHWTTFKPEKAYQSIDDPIKLVEKLVERLETDMEYMGEKSKVDPALVHNLRMLTPTAH